MKFSVRIVFALIPLSPKRRPAKTAPPTALPHSAWAAASRRTRAAPQPSSTTASSSNKIGWQSWIISYLMKNDFHPASHIFQKRFRPKRESGRGQRRDPHRWRGTRPRPARGGKGRCQCRHRGGCRNRHRTRCSCTSSTRRSCCCRECTAWPRATILDVLPDVKSTG